MTAEQSALYGGALWLGPVFLLAFLALYWWYEGTWPNRRRREKKARRIARWQAQHPQVPDDTSSDPTDDDQAGR
jgi:hypothetical protein